MSFFGPLTGELADSEWAYITADGRQSADCIDLFCRDEEVVAGYCSVLHSLMKESDKQPAAGLSFQIADTAIPELLGVLREAGDSIPDEPLRQLLDAFVSTMAVTVRKTLVARIRSARLILFDQKTCL